MAPARYSMALLLSLVALLLATLAAGQDSPLEAATAREPGDGAVQNGVQGVDQPANDTAAAVLPAELPTRCSMEAPCENFGTCHIVTGVCSCLPGYGGSMCEKVLLPACRYVATPNAQGAR